MSFDLLSKKIAEKSNPSVIGLDPVLDYIPKHILDGARARLGNTFEAAGEAIWEFNRGIIDACADVAPAVKPQSAFYEMYGLPGLEAMRKTAEYAKSAGMYVILDCKRGDIGSTCEAYAAAYLGGTDVFGSRSIFLDADCVTVNPYLGADGIKPFTDACAAANKAIFALVKTSNPSSGELQDLRLADGSTVYESVARLVGKWGASCSEGCLWPRVGAVVGATYPEQLREVRAILPDSFLLIPGYGAQGGGAEAVRYAFTRGIEGAVVNSSRAIMCAHKKDGDPEKYAQAARAEVLDMRDKLLSVLKT